MDNFQDLKNALSGIKGDLESHSDNAAAVNAGIDSILTALQALKDQVANGGTVNQQDFDAVVAEAQALDASGDELTASLESARQKLATATSVS